MSANGFASVSLRLCRDRILTPDKLQGIMTVETGTVELSRRLPQHPDMQLRTHINITIPHVKTLRESVSRRMQDLSIQRADTPAVEPLMLVPS